MESIILSQTVEPKVAGPKTLIECYLKTMFRVLLLSTLFLSKSVFSQGIQLNPIAFWPPFENLGPMPFEYFNDVASYETAVYFGTEHRGIQVFSKQPFIPIGNPQNNVKRALSLTVTGDYLLSAAGQYGLHVFDLSEPYLPQWVTSYPMDGFVKKVVSNDQYIAVLVESFEDHVLVFESTDPSQLRLVDRLDVGQTGFDLALAGHKVLVCNLTHLLVFDLANADSTVPTTFKPDPSANGNPKQTLSVTVHNSNVFLVIAERVPKELVILDIEDPLEIKTLSTIPLGVRASREPFGVWDSKLFFDNGVALVLVVDISDPSTPVLSSSDFAFDNYSSPILDADGILYLGRSSGVERYQFETRSELQPLGELNGVYAGNYDLEFLGDHYAVTAAGLGGLRVFDISNPSLPELTAIPIQLDRSTDIRQVETWKNMAAVLNGDGRLLLMDFSNPLDPVYLQTPGSFDDVLGVSFEDQQLAVQFKNGPIALYQVHSNHDIQKIRDLPHPGPSSLYPGGSSVMKLVDNKLVLADHFDVWILDLDQAIPTTQAIQIQPSIGQLRDVIYLDGKCYVLSLYKLEVYDATTGKVLQSMDVKNGSRSITLFRDRLYLTGSVLDSFSLDTLEWQGSIPMRGATKKCIVRGDFIYATGDAYGLAVVKPSSANPRFSTQIRVPWNVRDFEFRGETGFLKSYSDGALYLVDHSSPGNPSVLSRIGTDLLSWDFSVSDDGERVAVSSLSGTITLVDRNNETQVVSTETIEREWNIDEIAWVGPYLILAGKDRLEILDPNGGENSVIGSLSFSMMTTYCWDMIVVEDKVYLSFHRDGILVVDISSLTNPVILNHFEEITEVRQLIPFEDRLLALCDEEIVLLETQQDHSLQVLGRADGYYLDGIVLNDRLAYLVDGQVDVWDLQDPLHLRKVGANHGVTEARVIGLDGSGKLTVMGQNSWSQLEKFDERPRLKYQEAEGSDKVELWVESPLNGVFVLEASQDLLQWTPKSMLETPAGIPTSTGLTFDESDFQFYRLVKP